MFGTSSSQTKLDGFFPLITMIIFLSLVKVVTDWKSLFQAIFLCVCVSESHKNVITLN